MLSDDEKKILADLDLPCSPVAIKFCYSKPEGYEQFDGQRSLCTFIYEAQRLDRPFYITADNESCIGRYILGMADQPSYEASGSFGKEIGMFCTPAANARIYHSITPLSRGAHNYVLFSPTQKCDFDPDLLMLFCKPEQHDLICRAACWYTGDLWESVDAPVMGCAWMFAYPYVTGKINHSMTGMHSGDKTLHTHPAGLTKIAIPFGKIHQVLSALTELEWYPAPRLTGTLEEIEAQKAKSHSTND